MILAGDVGGTKTSLAIFSSSVRNLRKPLIQRTFSSAKFSDIESLLLEFMQNVERSKVDKVCLAVAGPVVGGESEITNLPWRISEEKIRRTLGISSVLLVNDLVATASFMPFLRDGVDYHVLNRGKPVSHGTIAVIAPGTGLGEAFLIPVGKKYRAFASEGGHTDFGPRNPEQIELLKYLQEEFDHVSYERVCSGVGVKEIHAFYHRSEERHAELSEKISSADDPVPVIVRAALGDVNCELCAKTLDTVVDIMGAEAGNLVLKVFATGGVYLAGGIPLRIRRVVEENFVEKFKSKGRLSGLLSDIPVYLVLNPHVCLFGAAKLGLDKFRKTSIENVAH